jgi:hypothetical protein
VIFYDVQGFVMQLLEEGMTGLFAINAASGLNLVRAKDLDLTQGILPTSVH